MAKRKKKRTRKAPVESSAAPPVERGPSPPPPPESAPSPATLPPPESTFKQEIDAVLDTVRTDLRTRMTLLGASDLLEPKGTRVFSRVDVDVVEQLAVRVDTLLFEMARVGGAPSVEAIDALMAELCLLRIATKRREGLWANPTMAMTALMAATAFPLWSIVSAMYAKKTAK